MKFLVLAVLFITSALAIDYDEIDWSQVLPRESEPGFWDNRDESLKPLPIDPRSRGRIIGGWEVVPHSHPYASFLLSSTATGSFRCGSSIISARAALTAAHCPHGTLSTLVMMGVHDVRFVEPTQQRRTVPAASYRLHANYNPSTLANDIAILIMPTAVLETPQIRYSRLPHDFRNELFTGELVSIVGWGRTCVTCPGSDVLRGVQNNIISNAQCRTFYSTVTDQFFCMQTIGQRGTCPGDSGGPYTLPRPGPSNQLQFIQIGVHSFGASSAVGGCEAQRPSGAVRTTVFLDWIATNMIP